MSATHKLVLLTPILLYPLVVSAQLTQSGTITLQGKITASASAGGGGGGNCSTSGLAITSPSPLPNGTKDAAYSQTITATGGITPYTFSVSNGSLPTGLSLNASTGLINGTPTVVGSSSFTLKVSDSTPGGSGGPCTNTQGNSITINPPPNPVQIVTTTLPDAIQGVAYSATLTVIGGTPPYTCAYGDTTRPPTGINLNSSCLVTGTTSATAQLYTFDVIATDSLASSSANTPIKLTVDTAGACGWGQFCSRFDQNVIPASNSPVAVAGKTAGTFIYGKPPDGLGPNTCTAGSWDSVNNKFNYTNLLSCNNQTGAGDCVTDPDLGNQICRLTDANTGNGASYGGGDAGGDRVLSIDSQIVRVKGSNGGQKLIGLSPAINNITINTTPFANLGAVAGNPGVLSTALSRNNARKVYTAGDGVLRVSTITGTAPNFAIGTTTTLFDGGTATCLQQDWVANAQLYQFWQIFPLTNNTHGNYFELQDLTPSGATVSAGSTQFNWDSTTVKQTFTDANGRTWTNVGPRFKIRGQSILHQSPTDGTFTLGLGSQNSPSALYIVVWQVADGLNNCKMFFAPTSHWYLNGVDQGATVPCGLVTGTTCTTPLSIGNCLGYWHETGATDNDSWIAIDGLAGSWSAAGTCHARFWQIGTNNITLCHNGSSIASLCGGHSQNLTVGQIAENGFMAIFHVPYTSGGPADGTFCNSNACGFVTDPNLIPPPGTPTFTPYQADEHISHLAGSAETDPISITKSFEPSSWGNGKPVLFGEVVQLQQGTDGIHSCSGTSNTHGCPFRFVYTFSSMQDICTAHPCNGQNVPGSHFEAAYIMEQESTGHSPYCFVWASDMMGTLGPGGPVQSGQTCTLAGTCRYDAFISCPK